MKLTGVVPEGKLSAKYDPSYLLRRYIWDVLKSNTDMKESDYVSPTSPNGLNPIVPVAEEAKLTQFDKPYLVYGTSSVPVESERHFKRRGSMTFVVYSEDFSEINDILNIIQTTFEREDEAARDVNNYTSQIDQFVGLRFGTISFGFMEGAVPEETEGGRQSGLINIRFEYYVDYHVVTSINPLPRS